MKFSCSQQQLSKALNIVSKAVTNRTTLPIQKGILLNVSEDGQLKMCASDMDTTIEDTISVNNYEAGSIVVMAKLFGDIIRKLPNDEIIIEEEKENVIIKCMNSEFSILGLSAEEFPTLKINEEMDTTIKIDKDILKEMIRKTSFAASIDESKGVISGILIEMESQQMNMVAIDGYRMAINRYPMVNVKEKEVIIPSKMMSDLSRILSEINEDQNEVEFSISEKKSIFVIGKVKIEIRLLDGEFIKYKEVLPKDSKIRIKVKREDLNESIERASLLSKEGKNNLIKMDIKDNVMVITSKSEEGKVKENVLIEKEGEDIEIGFNAKYVLDVLKSIDEEEIYMFLNTSITPCLVEPLNGDKYDYLILPVRITSK